MRCLRSFKIYINEAITQTIMTTKTPNHDLEHEVYLDPKDHKEMKMKWIRMMVRLMIGTLGMRISI